ncbi:hypothetical protein SDC9_157961 [bioreactor metagenome]|uniref:Uncharacterized protein n=1 Tax=bioreactor metagenome TaxID=1076179 RepID=A0A645FAM7_9ZZZZ
MRAEDTEVCKGGKRILQKGMVNARKGVAVHHDFPVCGTAQRNIEPHPHAQGIGRPQGRIGGLDGFKRNAVVLRDGTEGFAPPDRMEGIFGQQDQRLSHHQVFGMREPVVRYDLV